METIIAAAQMRADPGEVAANLLKAKRFVAHAADEGAHLVLLPELFNIGYQIGPKLFEWWESEDGHTVSWMREEAVKRNMLVAGSIAERRGERLYNTLFIAEPHGELHKYAKRQPTKSEVCAFDAGREPNIVQTSLGRFGVAVCADMTWGASLLRPLAGDIDLMLVPQASNGAALAGETDMAAGRKLGRRFFRSPFSLRRGAGGGRRRRSGPAPAPRPWFLPTWWTGGGGVGPRGGSSSGGFFGWGGGFRGGAGGWRPETPPRFRSFRSRVGGRVLLGAFVNDNRISGPSVPLDARRAVMYL